MYQLQTGVSQPTETRRKQKGAPKCQQKGNLPDDPYPIRTDDHLVADRDVFLKELESDTLPLRQQARIERS